MPGRVRFLAVALAVVAGAAVAALTTTRSDDDGGGVNLIAHSAELAEDAGTARMLFTGTISAEGQSVSFGGEGVMAGDRGRLTMTFSAPPGVPGAGESFEMEIVTVGTVLSMRMPGLSQLFGTSTPWVSFDMAKTDPDFGATLGSPGARSNDPRAMLDSLRGATDDFEEVGEEPVRGVPTTHYRGVVDLDAAAGELSGEERAAFERGVTQLREAGTVEIPIDVWIDGDGLPRRMRYALDVAASPEIPSGMTMEFTMELYDYGADLSVEPPPADEVTDVTELFGRLGGMGTEAA